MKRTSIYAAVIAAVLVAVLAVVVLRDRERTGAASPPPSGQPSVTPAETVPASRTSAAPSPTTTAQPVLSDRFGFVVRNSVAIVRSETSDAPIISFTPRGRSFTSLSRMVSPDGRSVAYWDPVAGGAVLRVRPAGGGDARAALTVRPEMSGNAFAWSADSMGLVVALDNNCQEFCPGIYELWTVDLPSGATEKVASGSIWLPVTWDRAASIIGAGVTGPGGYLTGYDLIDLSRQPYQVRSTPFRPTILGRLKASSDARYILLNAFTEGAAGSFAWWPTAEPERRSSFQVDAVSAEWRPGTSEIWWVDGLTPPGCRSELCTGMALTSLDVATGARTTVHRGRFGSFLEGFRVDGTAAIVADSATVRTELMLIEVATGRTARASINGALEGSARLR
jgi:hypothetical protein